MNKFKRIFLILIIYTSIANAENVTKKDIIGLWRVVDFIIISKNGEMKQWADNIHGTLVYTRDNFMSVSINGKRNGNDVFLFYSGTVKVCKNNIIKHKVDNATDPKRINRVMTRAATYENGILTLRAHGDYGQAIVKWERFKLPD